MGLKLIFIIAGFGLSIYGYQEHTLTQIADTEPARLDIANLEQGRADLSNAHVVIGTHIAAYPDCIFEFQQSGSKEPAPTDKLNYVYYPILSEGSPYIQQLRPLLVRYPNGIPESVAYPELRDVAVMVKTRQFETVADIPERYVRQDSVTGMFINEVSRLDQEEVGLLQGAFPYLDTDRILLLELDRKPVSQIKAMALLGGGGVLMMLGIGMLFVRPREE